MPRLALESTEGWSLFCEQLCDYAREISSRSQSQPRCIPLQHSQCTEDAKMKRQKAQSEASYSNVVTLHSCIPPLHVYLLNYSGMPSMQNIVTVPRFHVFDSCLDCERSKESRFLFRPRAPSHSPWGTPSILHYDSLPLSDKQRRSRGT